MSQNPVYTKYFTKGDRLVRIADTLVDAAGVPIDLSSSTVTFRMISDADDSVKINNAAATIDSAADGNVSYAWAAADVDTAGTYWGFWDRTSGGLTARYPPDGKRLKIIIEARY